jgi:filamentous hemagglutinin
MGSGKTITLNATGGSVLSPTFNSTSATQALTIGGSNTTTNITLGSAQTSGTITVGNATPASDSGTLTINKSTTLGASKNLTLASTGTLTTDTISGTGVGTNPALFSTTTTGNVTLGSAQTSGNVTIGHTTVATDAGTLTINKTTTLGSNKNLSLQGTGSLTLSTGGSLNCRTYNSTSTAQGMTVGDNLLIGGIDIGLGQTSGNIRMGNITPASDTGSLTINKNVTVGSGKTITLNATGGSVLSSTFNSTSATQALTVGGSNTTTDITIGAGQTSGSITLGNTTVANDSGILTVNKNVTVGSGKTITLNATGGKVLCNTLEGTATNTAISAFGTTLSTIALGNLGGGTLTINPPLTLSSVVTLASGITLTLNATGGKILCNVLTGTTTTDNMFIGESGNTGTLQIYKDVTIGTTASNNLLVNNISPIVNTDTMSIGGASTVYIQGGASGSSNNVYIGSSTPANDSGTLVVNKTTTFSANKTITMNATGGVIKSNVLTGVATSSAITIGVSGDTSTVTMFKDTVIGTGKNLTLSSSGTLSTDKIRGTGTGTTITIGDDQILNGNITIGNATPASDVGTLTLNKNTTMATGKNITMSSTGTLSTDKIRGTGTGTTITIGDDQILNGNITIGNATPASDVGTLTINKTTTLATNKNLTLQGTGKVTTPNILVSGLSASKLVLTDASDNLVSSSFTDTDLAPKNNPTFTTAIGLTSGNLTLSSGNLVCNTAVGTAVGGNISLYATTTGSITMGGASSGITMDDTVSVNTIQGTTATSAVSLYGTTTTTAINIGAAQTSGTMRIGNATAASDSGTLTINKTTTVASTKTLTTGPIVASSIQCNTYTAPGGFVFGTNASQGAGSTVNNNYRFQAGGYYVVYSFSTGEVSYSSSTINHKYDVITAERDWNSVLDIRPVEYTFITNQVRRLGAIAEEVYDINPDFAIMDGQPTPGAVDWFNVVLYQNEVIKENRQRIEALEASLTTLTATVLAMQP